MSERCERTSKRSSEWFSSSQRVDFIVILTQCAAILLPALDSFLASALNGAALLSFWQQRQVPKQMHDAYANPTENLNREVKGGGARGM